MSNDCPFAQAIALIEKTWNMSRGRDVDGFIVTARMSQAGRILTSMDLNDDAAELARAIGYMLDTWYPSSHYSAHSLINLVKLLQRLASS